MRSQRDSMQWSNLEGAAAVMGFSNKRTLKKPNPIMQTLGESYAIRPSSFLGLGKLKPLYDLRSRSPLLQIALAGLHAWTLLIP